VKVCDTLLSPEVGVVLPTIAAADPLCATDEMLVAPDAIQADNPDSKPPLTMPVDEVTVNDADAV
jgi:hypothetical protein